MRENLKQLGMWNTQSILAIQPKGTSHGYLQKQVWMYPKHLAIWMHPKELRIGTFKRNCTYECTQSIWPYAKATVDIECTRSKWTYGFTKAIYECSQSNFLWEASKASAIMGALKATSHVWHQKLHMNELKATGHIDATWMNSKQQDI